MSGFKLTHEGLLTPDAGQFQAGAEGLFADFPGNVRHHMVGRQFYRIRANRALAAQTAAQNLFAKNPSVRANTVYSYQIGFRMGFSSTSVSVANLLFGGTATFSNALSAVRAAYGSSIGDGGAHTFTAGSATATMSTPLAFCLYSGTAAITSAVVLAYGTFETNAAGTLIPQITQSAVVTPTLAAGAYFWLSPMVQGGADVEIGSWA